MRPYDHIIDFLFEVGSLTKLKRSHLKQNTHSVAEHSFRVTVIGFILAKICKADIQKTLSLCLFHDVVETRTGDIDVVQKNYVSVNEEKALKEIAGTSGLLKELRSFTTELNQNKMLEARLTHDADVLEELLTEREQYDAGEQRAMAWMKYSLARLKTPEAQALGKIIFRYNSDKWWTDIIKR